MSGPVETGAAPLHLLLEVQEHDIRLDQLHHELASLPARRRLATAEKRRGELATRESSGTADEESLARRQQELESRISSLSTRISAIESRMKEGSSAYRDLQAMSDEAASLARQRSLIEDEELELMEQAEATERTQSALRAEIAALEEEARGARHELSEASSALEATAAAVREEREQLAAGLPPDLFQIYERLRQRLGGVGAARLVDGSCTGCHLHLPSSERERVQKAGPGELVYCEQCGRILIA